MVGVQPVPLPAGVLREHAQIRAAPGRGVHRETRDKPAVDERGRLSLPDALQHQLRRGPANRPRRRRRNRNQRAHNSRRGRRVPVHNLLLRSHNQREGDDRLVHAKTPRRTLGPRDGSARAHLRRDRAERSRRRAARTHNPRWNVDGRLRIPRRAGQRGGSARHGGLLRVPYDGALANIRGSERRRQRRNAAHHPPQLGLQRGFDVPFPNQRGRESAKRAPDCGRRDVLRRSDKAKSRGGQGLRAKRGARARRGVRERLRNGAWDARRVGRLVRALRVVVGVLRGERGARRRRLRPSLHVHA